MKLLCTDRIPTAKVEGERIVNVYSRSTHQGITRQLVESYEALLRCAGYMNRLLVSKVVITVPNFDLRLE